MVKKYTLRPREVREPITEPVTKLGGQPVWIDAPQWPLSRALGEPMRFIGQFELFPEIFGLVKAKVAYLFMTESDTHVDGTWEPDGGENAVILQPGSRWAWPTRPLRQGPTLYERVAAEDGTGTREEPREYAVELEPGEDPDVLDESEFRKRGEWERYCDYVAESKIGGAPAFLQYPEFPGPGTWRLIAQLDASIVPAGPNFGDAGIGYVFLSEDGQVAKFLWQCS